MYSKYSNIELNMRMRLRLTAMTALMLHNCFFPYLFVISVDMQFAPVCVYHWLSSSFSCFCDWLYKSCIPLFFNNSSVRCQCQPLLFQLLCSLCTETTLTAHCSILLACSYFNEDWFCCTQQVLFWFHCILL